MSQLYYLATPYSHSDKNVMDNRFRMACDITAFLLRNGLNVFSPIAHSHPIAVLHELPTGFEFWRKYDEGFLSRCTDIIIVKAHGWLNSVGMKHEIQYAIDHGLFMHYMDYPNYQKWFIDERSRGLI